MQRLDIVARGDGYLGHSHNAISAPSIQHEVMIIPYQLLFHLMFKKYTVDILTNSKIINM